MQCVHADGSGPRQRQEVDGEVLAVAQVRRTAHALTLKTANDEEGETAGQEPRNESKWPITLVSAKKP